MSRSERQSLSIDLNAAIVGYTTGTPQILTLETNDQHQPRALLPFGPFNPTAHRTFELALRAFVEEQTGQHIGYVEQLYTFGDRGRVTSEVGTQNHLVSVGYLALSEKAESQQELVGAKFEPWYQFFPWEDWREGRPDILDTYLLPELQRWAGDDSAGLRQNRLKLAFGLAGLIWDDERVLERYELLHEAGLALEAHDDEEDQLEVDLSAEEISATGRPMAYDHRRILATAISRLRAKIKYRPLVFELMEKAFTLTDLQKTVEALAGRVLHKQNFRRLVEANQLVEPTGQTSTATGGRPAQLYQFRKSIVLERPFPGIKV